MHKLGTKQGTKQITINLHSLFKASSAQAYFTTHQKWSLHDFHAFEAKSAFNFELCERINQVISVHQAIANLSETSPRLSSTKCLLANLIVALERDHNCIVLPYRE